jgi:hypothetical protein
MYFHPCLKNLKIQKKNHLLLNPSNIEISCLIIYLSIVLKIDKCHWFLKVQGFFFHAWEAMGNEIFKHDFFSHMYMCVDVVRHLVIC